MSSINRILRNRAAERAAQEFARNYQLAAAASAAHYQAMPSVVPPSTIHPFASGKHFYRISNRETALSLDETSCLLLDFSSKHDIIFCSTFPFFSTVFQQPISTQDMPINCMQHGLLSQGMEVIMRLKECHRQHLASGLE